MKRKVSALLIEILAGILLLRLLLAPFFSALYEEDTSGGGFHTFYREKKDSIDVMVFGSSHAACSFNNDILWKESGIASFTLSCGGQNLPETVWYIREALKTQSPKVILIETLNADSIPFSEESGHYEMDMGELYRSDLSVRWGPSYIRMIAEQAQRYGMDEALKWEMMLKFPVTHSNYDSLTKEDYEWKESYVRGYRGDDSTGTCELPEQTEERAALSPLCLESLEKIIGSCEEKGVTPVFFCAPYHEEKDAFATQNALGDYVRERGYEFVDFNREYEKYGFDFETDFRDDGNHLNDSGAEKLTRALLSLLEERFDLPDRRGSADYIAWDLNSRYLSDREAEHALRRTEGFREYIDKLSDFKEDFGIILSLSGDYNALGEDFIGDAFEPIDFSQEDYGKGGTAVFDRGQLAYYSNSEDTYRFAGKLGECEICVAKPIGETGEYHLVLDGVDHAFIDNGATLVVFDPELGRLIDVIGVDVYTSRDPVRE